MSPVFDNPNYAVTSGINRAATITLTGVTDYCQCISGFSFSYSAAPTNGSANIQITDNGFIVFNLDIVSTKEYSIYFYPALAASNGNNLVITLSAAGAGITGKLNILGVFARSAINSQVTQGTLLTQANTPLTTQSNSNITV